MKNPLGEIENTRTLEQRKHMEESIGQGTCPFCKIDETLNIPVRKYEYWHIWFNPFPYPHQKHMIIALKRHEVDVQKLVATEWLELLSIIQWAVAKYRFRGGGIVMRFGDPSVNAGTLTHIHVHIQVPDGQHTAISVFGKGSSWPQIERLLRAER